MIALTNISLRQGKFALTGISLAISAGQYGVLMGKSGCGKTTILESIAGLRHTVKGTISLVGKDVTRLSPGSRHIGYVPQDGALFQTMTVRDNLAFALDIRGAARNEVTQRVNELADWLALTHILHRKPAFLSGGEKQRVALGRALAFRPPVLLLDEPLGSLDEETRDNLIELLTRIRNRRDITVLHITHNQSEADRLGDIVFRLENGRISQTIFLASKEV